ncbi:unnamed protein product [Prorocentrum cordatum]|uniref:Uncharacterized protein n=1 Tax=Prorocentrum cordatum TaxID=2364126 RepID=A0ABN9QPP1_9DINO|nr:unnamed protein product [Polarella glacialis]
MVWSPKISALPAKSGITLCIRVLLLLVTGGRARGVHGESGAAAAELDRAAARHRAHRAVRARGDQSFPVHDEPQDDGVRSSTAELPLPLPGGFGEAAKDAPMLTLAPEPEETPASLLASMPPPEAFEECSRYDAGDTFKEFRKWSRRSVLAFLCEVPVKKRIFAAQAREILQLLADVPEWRGGGADDLASVDIEAALLQKDPPRPGPRGTAPTAPSGPEDQSFPVHDEPQDDGVRSSTAELPLPLPGGFGEAAKDAPMLTLAPEPEETPASLLASMPPPEAFEECSRYDAGDTFKEFRKWSRRSVLAFLCEVPVKKRIFAAQAREILQVFWGLVFYGQLVLTLLLVALVIVGKNVVFPDASGACPADFPHPAQWCAEGGVACVTFPMCTSSGLADKFSHCQLKRLTADDHRPLELVAESTPPMRVWELLAKHVEVPVVVLFGILLLCTVWLALLRVAAAVVIWGTLALNAAAFVYASALPRMPAAGFLGKPRSSVAVWLDEVQPGKLGRARLAAQEVRRARFGAAEPAQSSIGQGRTSRAEKAKALSPFSFFLCPRGSSGVSHHVPTDPHETSSA